MAKEIRFSLDEKQHRQYEKDGRAHKQIYLSGLRVTSKMTTGGRLRDEDITHAPNGIDTQRQYGQAKFRSDSRAARLNK